MGRWLHPPRCLSDCTYYSLLALCCRFDNDLHKQAGDIAGERNMKDHLQRERDQLLKQKYNLGQQLEVK